MQDRLISKKTDSSLLEDTTLWQANYLLKRVACPSANRIGELNNVLDAIKTFDLPRDLKVTCCGHLADLVVGASPGDVRLTALKRTSKLAGIFATVLFGFPLVVGQVDFANESIPTLVVYSILAWIGVCVALFVVLAPIFVPVIIADSKRSLIDARCKAADVLGVWAEPISLEVLALASQEKDPILRSSAQKALTRSIAGTTPELYGVVPVSAQLKLAALLSHRDAYTELKLHVLEGLGRFGGGAVLEDVSRVAAIDDREGLGEAARSILPILEDRARRERNGSTFVRATTNIGELLLRPTQFNDLENNPFLLHPTSNPEVTDKESSGSVAEEKGCSPHPISDITKSPTTRVD